MRAKLMLELSGTSYQEALVIKAIAGTPLGFEKVGRCVVSHYGSVHLRGGRHLTSSSSGGPPKRVSRGKGKGKPR